MEILLLLMAIALIALITFGRRGKPYELPQSTMADPAIFRHYEAAPSLFVNRSELALFHALSRAAPRGYHVLTKPRLEDIIGVKKDLPNPKLAFQLRGRVKSRHVDFLIINGEGRPCVAIELDGTSHQNKSAEAGDHLKDGIFKAARLPFRRVTTGQDFAQAARQICEEILPPGKSLSSP